MYFTLVSFSSQGDSGGPIIQYDGADPVVMGLSSFVVACGDWKFPAVFARLSAFVEWIEKRTPAKFETNTGKRSNIKCKVGQFISGKSCKNCSKFSVSKGGTVTKCRKCENGFVRDSSNGSKCSCKGEFAIGKGTVGKRCVVCKRGTFAGKSSSICKRCPNGLSSGVGAAKCV